MEELIQKIMTNAGLTVEQTMKTLETIKDYVKEQYPMMGGAVDKLFESAGKSGGASGGNDEDYL